MIEKVISLGAIEPIQIYGVNNTLLDKIKGYFPKLQIVARGSEIKVLGAPEDIELFEIKMNAVVAHFDRFSQISESRLDEIITDNLPPADGQIEDILLYGNNGKIIRAKTPNQRQMVDDSNLNDLLFAIGPAGTGKTYQAIALAVRALKNRQVRKIILSRPAVEAEESLGFLPGDMKDKLDPYLQPLYDALSDMLPNKKLAEYMKENIIEIAPLAYMRGRTLNNAFAILDEAQNATINQMKMFLTRMGENSKFIVTGDITQIDLPIKQKSGLVQCARILKGIPGIAFVYFNKKDIVRHNLVKHIVDAYDQERISQAKAEEAKSETITPESDVESVG